MARVPGCEAVYEVANQWRDRCLAADGSLLWPDLSDPTWTVENLERARDITLSFKDAPHARDIDIQREFSSEQPGVQRAIADAFGIFYLFPGQLKTDHKLKMVAGAASWSGEPADLSLIDVAIRENIGKPETNFSWPGFQLQRDAHLSLILVFGVRIKSGNIDPYDSSAVAAILTQITMEIKRSASSRNMLIHALFPDHFESIFNNKAKTELLNSVAFSQYSQIADADERLTTIRQDLAHELGRAAFSFYDDDVLARWKDSAQEDTTESIDRNYWWVNQGQSYTIERDGGYIWAGKHNRAGQTMWHHETMNDLKIGDLIIHYANLQLRALGLVTETPSGAQRPSMRQPESGSADGYRASIDYREFIPPINVSELPDHLRQSAKPPFNVRGDVQQVYLVPITAEWTAWLHSLFPDRWPNEDGFQPPKVPIRGDKNVSLEGPEIVKLSAVCYLAVSDLSEIESLLRTKKQIIFEGPPGSGKTYLARLFARYLAGLPLTGPPDPQVEIVQFHQSYGYEDFVAGIRPVTTHEGGLHYQNQPGLFLEMCDRGTKNPDKNIVLIIDEINRGNLSRILGELLYALEYREEPVRMQFPDLLGDSESDHLTIPGNLYLIGTMNSTDRSLAMIDYALRRRFFFWRLTPAVDGDAPVLRKWLEGRVELSPARRLALLSSFIELNRLVSNELGEDYQIGHSYFMVNEDQDLNDEETVRSIWKHALNPLLHEYYHSSPDASKQVNEFELILFPSNQMEIGQFVDAMSSDEI